MAILVDFGRFLCWPQMVAQAYWANGACACWALEDYHLDSSSHSNLLRFLNCGSQPIADLRYLLMMSLHFLWHPGSDFCNLQWKQKRKLDFFRLGRRMWTPQPLLTPLLDSLGLSSGKKTNKKYTFKLPQNANQHWDHAPCIKLIHFWALTMRVFQKVGDPKTIQNHSIPHWTWPCWCWGPPSKKNATAPQAPPASLALASFNAARRTSCPSCRVYRKTNASQKKTNLQRTVGIGLVQGNHKLGTMFFLLFQWSAWFDDFIDRKHSDHISPSFWGRRSCLPMFPNVGWFLADISFDHDGIP